MRFEARHIGSGRWGVYDGGVMGWRAVDLGEDEARQMAIDMAATVPSSATFAALLVTGSGDVSIA